MNILLKNVLTYFQNMKRHLDQELIIIKTKAISSDTARHRKPKFNKISWIKENVKTLGYIMVTMLTMIKFGRTLLIE